MLCLQTNNVPKRVRPQMALHFLQRMFVGALHFYHQIKIPAIWGHTHFGTAFLKKLFENTNYLSAFY